MMQDPIYSQITDTPRPTLTAASGFVWLAAIGLWLAELVLLALPEGIRGSMAVQNAAYYLPFIALPLALALRRRPGLAGSMRLNPLPAIPTLSLALLAVLSVYAASVLTALWGAGLDALGLRGVGGAALPAPGRSWRCPSSPWRPSPRCARSCCSGASRWRRGRAGAHGTPWA